MKSKKEYLYYLIPIVLLVALDQLTKYLVTLYLSDGEPFILIPDILSFRYLVNHGAAWGVMQGKTIILICFTVIMMAFLLYLFFVIPQDRKYRKIRLVFPVLFAGAIGNLIDRLTNKGGVVDFIYFEPIDFPKFNLADCYITVSVFILAFLILFSYKNDDMQFWSFQTLFHKKQNGKQSKDADIKEKHSDDGDIDG